MRSDPVWFGINLVVLSMSTAIGRESRKLAGHPLEADAEDMPELPAKTKSGQHRQRGRGVTAQGERKSEPSFWKGRWASLYALGEGDRACERLCAATTEALAQFYLSADPITFGTVEAFEERARAKLVSEINRRTAYHKHLPHKLAGTFGQYLGAYEAASKQCLQECLDEFDANPNPNMHAPQSLRLCRRGRSERAMCEQ